MQVHAGSNRVAVHMDVTAQHLAEGVVVHHGVVDQDTTELVVARYMVVLRWDGDLLDSQEGGLPVGEEQVCSSSVARLVYLHLEGDRDQVLVIARL